MTNFVATLPLGLAPPTTLTGTPGMAKRESDRVRVAVAEDDVLLREGLASLFERNGYDVVGQAVAKAAADVLAVC